MFIQTLLAANLVLALTPAPRKWVAQTPPPPGRPPISMPPRPMRNENAPAPAQNQGGSGNAVVRANPNADDGPPGIDTDERRKKAKFSFEFSKAEVTDIVKAISDMTQQNYIIPEKIKGQRITILSPTKITAAEAYQVFHTALAANGISIVRSGRFYKLVDAKDALKDTIPTCIDDDTGACETSHEQMVTVLLHLRHVDAGQINAIAKALMSKDGDIAVFQPSNALIISEYAPNLQRVRRIIDALDVAGNDDELQLLQIQYSSAQEISEKLTQIFDISKPGGGGGPPVINTTRHGAPVPAPGVPQQQQQGGANNNGQDDDIVITKIVPDDRTNQLIIKANRKAVEAIKNLIAKLDVPMTESEQGRVHVYYLENAKAEELASTLSSLASGTPAPKRGPGAAAANAPPNAGQPAQAPGGAAGGQQMASLFEGDVKITADKATNSLLIMSSAHDYRAMRSIIEKLDKSRRQVYVEAAILEVNISDNDDFALNFHAPFGFPNNELFGLPLNPTVSGFAQSAETGQISPTFSALTSSSALISALGGSVGGLLGAPKELTVGANGEIVTIPTFGVLLKWLTSSSNANVLSTPHILTTDNEQAHIEVGEKIPFNSGFLGGLQSSLGSLAGSSTSSSSSSALGGLGAGALGLGGLGALGGQVQRIDVSLKLTLTPQINERNKIRLEIDQTVEDVVGQDSKSQTPTTSHRSIKTVVVVDDQQTIVLGGLIKDSTTDSESKIPFLGDLPIVGWLFKQHSTKIAKKNLMLVLTPYIIGGPDDFTRIFERKMREHEEFAAEYYGHQKAYRAHVDYTKKMGPVGRMVSTLRRERARIENGGTGDGSEIMVGPKAVKQRYPGQSKESEPGEHMPGEEPSHMLKPHGDGQGNGDSPGGSHGAPHNAPGGDQGHEAAPANAEPSGAAPAQGGGDAAPPGGGDAGNNAAPSGSGAGENQPPRAGPPPGFVPFPAVPAPTPAPAQPQPEGE